MSEINIVQIQTALLVPITGTFIVEKLGIQPVRRDKKACFWKPEQYQDIAQALIRHVTTRREVDITGVSGERKKPVADDFFAEEPATADDFFA